MTDVNKRRAWSREAKRVSLSLAQPLLKEAKANFAAAAAADFKLLLAREIAQTRGAELALAYRNVVMVAAGFKRKRARNGNERLTTTPCVVFIVRRKWREEQTQTSNAQHLPRWLVTFAESGGVRKPFAVPTDVQVEAPLVRVRPRARQAVWVDEAGVTRETGTLTCTVTLADGPGAQLYLMSAQHVLSPLKDVSKRALTSGRPVRLIDTAGSFSQAPIMGTSVPYGGLLRDDERADRPSFDVQLARIDDLESAKAAIAAVPLWPAEPFVTDLSMLARLNNEQFFELLVCQNHPDALGPRSLQAEFDLLTSTPLAIEYDLRFGVSDTKLNVYHRELVRMRVRPGKVPIPGDSGCPVVARRNGDAFTLVGMFIASHDRDAYVIPAWDLFDADQYWNLPEGARVRPVGDGF